MRLYRYQSINKFALENLILKKNWASNTKYFNDPFEFSLRGNYDVDKNGQVNFLSQDNQVILSEVRERVSKIGVISYSETYESTLMWSHYASNHEGMCLVFEVDLESIDNLYKVNYEDMLPYFDFEGYINYHPVLITKSKIWSYEKEYRQLFSFNEHHFDPPGKLTEIIFGCQTSAKDIEVIFNICEFVYSNEVTFTKMHIQKDTFYLASSTIFRKKGDKVPKYWDGKFID